MPEALEGSQAIARAVALCRPQVVAAYPITPQTHIVEAISRLVADGDLHCEMVSVESEFSAASVALGAAAAGSRAYTASASQGILLMAEVLFDIAGLRVPMVLTCANRAVSGPLSIWNDQQDSMAVRDAGWIQLYCADNQEAVDTTLQAFRIAERTELPVMVCVDGFTLTHTLEPIELPDQVIADRFLPPYEYSRRLDPVNPISVGTLVSPDYYTEVRHSHHSALLRAIDEIEAAASDWAELTGRHTGGLVAVEGDGDARLGIVATGSVNGTLREARRRGLGGEPVRLIRLRSFRPFPARALQAACEGLDRVAVIDRALSPGMGGIIGSEVRSAFADVAGSPVVHNFALGLGGRDIPLEVLSGIIEALARGDGRPFSILDVELEKLPGEDR